MAVTVTAFAFAGRSAILRRARMILTFSAMVSPAVSNLAAALPLD